MFLMPEVKKVFPDHDSILKEHEKFFKSRKEYDYERMWRLQPIDEKDDKDYSLFGIVDVRTTHLFLAKMTKKYLAKGLKQFLVERKLLSEEAKVDVSVWFDLSAEDREDPVSDRMFVNLKIEDLVAPRAEGERFETLFGIVLGEFVLNFLNYVLFILEQKKNEGRADFCTFHSIKEVKVGYIVWFKEEEEEEVV